MQQAAYKCETPLFEQKSSATFWAIKRSQQTKFEKLLTLNKAQENMWAKYGPIVVKLVNIRGGNSKITKNNLFLYLFFFSGNPGYICQ